MNFNAPVVTMLYAAICGVLLIVLALNIVRLRRGHRISLGMGEGSALEQPVRVHGNFTEYTPTFLILLLLAELGGAAFWFLHLLGAAFVAGRTAACVRAQHRACAFVRPVLRLADFVDLDPGAQRLPAGPFLRLSRAIRSRPDPQPCIRSNRNCGPCAPRA